MFMVRFGTVVAVAGALAMTPTGTSANETIKFAAVEALSGPMASAGDLAVKHFQFIVDKINEQGGVLGRELELITFDSKMNPQESVIAAERAIESGAKFITQGSGSSVGHAINDFLTRHNQRNPDSRALFFNYASIDPGLTDERCNFWHFRVYAHTDMMLHAVAEHFKTQPEIEKLYLLNQDYSYGHAISAKANELIPEVRPDIEIVGDSFHAVASVTDFSPYVQRIRSSGADTVITGNWGSDMTLLIRAAADAGLDVDWYTFYGGFLGAPTAIGEAGVDRLKLVTDWHANVPDPEMESWNTEFQERYGYDWTYYRAKVMVDMLVDAIEEVGELDVEAIAHVLSNKTFETPFGEWRMRSEDHQASHPIYVATFSADVEYDVENTGFGFKTDARIDPEVTVTPVQCVIDRP